VASGELSLSHFDGNLDQAIDGARAALLIATDGSDPFALTGLLSMYSYSLILTCRYEESLNRPRVYVALQRVAVSSSRCPMPGSPRESARWARQFAPAARTLSQLEREMQDEPGTFFRAAFLYSALDCTGASAI
jgi:hypothetical protein